MFAYPVLVADIGGTNSRFSIVAEPGHDPQMLGRFQTADFAGPIEAIKAALTKTDLVPKSVACAWRARCGSALPFDQCRLDN